ncbi:uncharacterized protein SOCE26_057770 [Sorangium cellulosum]|uniref:SHSP domain-containing protein n=1 Tax=Sorangium cellulosum TaxID=56 RepID=A0A2L0EYF0_SORCE|nr:Hsp20/alpha crystallin family protein [Sorangium cellulosum]AUX44313.1 uncharacterized protein SOCE26_057770 [Sorangium cellulosum]
MLTRHDPFLAENALRSFFVDPFAPLSTTALLRAVPRMGGLPPTDLVETDSAVEVVSDVPGMGPDDVHVEANDGWLVVRGQRSEGGYRGGFERAFYLGDGCALAEASASLEHGVLRVRVPKARVAAPEVKHIPVRAAEGSDRSGTEGTPGLLARAKRALSQAFRSRPS